jgi:alpha-D-ribose 1-methylphosphonate 5-triphosphate synthase subunit PhnH
MSVPVLTPRSAREQRAFRALLDAMARPGTVAEVLPHPQGGRLPHAVTVLEAMLDHEVSFAVAPEHASVIETLLRLTGSHHAALEDAGYMLCEGEGISRALRAARTGTPEYPDRSATVIAMVESVSESAPTSRSAGEGAVLSLAGPGINGRRTVYVSGFTAELRKLFSEANADLPMGIDLVLLAPDGHFTCLSRYTRLIEED